MKKSSSPLFAATARVDLTNPQPSGKVLDPLYAKVLALQNAQKTLILITMDVTAIAGRHISDGMLPDGGENFMPKLRRILERDWNLAADGLLVNASHTHPSGRLLCDDDEQLKRVVSACREAMQHLVPARIGFARASAQGFIMNRNLELNNGRDGTLRHTNPTPADEQVAGVRRVDENIELIRIDKMDDSPLALVYNFGCHPLFGDCAGSLTANFPGHISATLETLLGGDAMAFFLQGSAGDVIDRGFKDFSRPRQISSMGKLLALEIFAKRTQIETVPDVILEASCRQLQLPRRQDADTKLMVLRQQQEQCLQKLHYCTLNFKNFLPLWLRYQLYPKYPLADAAIYLQAQAEGDSSWREMDALNQANLNKYLANISCMEELSRIVDDMQTLEKHQRLNQESASTQITAEVQLLRINNCAILTTGTELLTEVALDLKNDSPFQHTMVAAYSNGYLHYGAPPELYERGGYEVTECLLAPEWAEIFKNAALEMMQQAFIL